MNKRTRGGITLKEKSKAAASIAGANMEYATDISEQPVISWRGSSGKRHKAAPKKKGRPRGQEY